MVMNVHAEHETQFFPHLEFFVSVAAVVGIPLKWTIIIVMQLCRVSITLKNYIIIQYYYTLQ